MRKTEKRARWLSWIHVFLWLILPIVVVLLAQNSFAESNTELKAVFRNIQVHPDYASVLSGEQPLEDFIKDGKDLFATRFNRFDGAGRRMSTGDSKPTIRTGKSVPMFHRLAGPDANSCTGCHNQPAAGGAGDFVANAFVGAHFTDPPTNSIEPAITNERNTISVFGAGVIEMLAFEMSQNLHALRDEAIFRSRQSNQDVRIRLVTKDVDFGFLIAHPDGSYDASEIEGVDIDLVVKPFGVKGVAVSIREFTNFALNQHHGIQPEERFGWSRTGVSDFDGDGISNEFTTDQVTALSLYQATLPPPTQVTPDDPSAQVIIERGRRVFQEIGCSSCHRPAMQLRSMFFFEPNPLNRPGSAIPDDVGGQVMVPLHVADGTGLYHGENFQLYVAAFTDLKRHRICEADRQFFCNEEVIQDFVPTDQFLTSKLWDVGSSMPYGHRGDLTTLAEAIAHHGGEAREQSDKFLAQSSTDQMAVISFLKSLRIVLEPIGE